MSGYSGDRDDRDYDDRDDRDDRRGSRDDNDIRNAKSRVTAPAIGLIVVGALTLMSSLLGFVQLPVMRAQFDEMIRQTENNPNVPAQQKQQQVEMYTAIRDFFVNYGVALYAVVGVLGLVIVVGGVRLMQLGSPALVILGSLGAMIPLSACCLLGLVFGIWALVAMSKPEVKAGFAAKRRQSTSSDSY